MDGLGGGRVAGRFTVNPRRRIRHHNGELQRGAQRTQRTPLGDGDLHTRLPHQHRHPPVRTGVAAPDGIAGRSQGPCWLQVARWHRQQCQDRLHHAQPPLMGEEEHQVQRGLPGPPRHMKTVA